MQTKPQAAITKTSTPVVQVNKVEPQKQPQPLDLKAMQQVGGGGRSFHPGSGW